MIADGADWAGLAPDELPPTPTGATIGEAVDLDPADGGDEPGVPEASPESARFDAPEVLPPFRDLALAVYREAETSGDPEWAHALPEERAAAVAGRILTVARVAHVLEARGYTGPGAQARYEADMATVHGAAGPAAPEPARPGRVGVDLVDFLAAGQARVNWHVDGAIVRGGFVLALGLWESFKSMGLLHLGACSASGEPWLGMDVEERPFLYVSNEKSPETIRDRLRRIVAPRVLRERVVIVHRQGVRFDRKWDEVIRLAEELGGPFVGLDTLASLSPAGFNENRSEHMSIALDAIRELTTRGSTVALAHHPSKATGGAGRGHGSLDGEIDGTLEFDRPDRDKFGVNLSIRPKDGEHRRIRLAFNPDTFLLELDVIGPAATATEVAATVRVQYRKLGRPVKTALVRGEFPNHGERVIRERLAEAKHAGLIVQVGSGPATAYLPAGADGAD